MLGVSRPRFRTKRFSVGKEFGGSVGVSASNVEIGASLGESKGDRGANSAGASGDQDIATSQVIPDCVLLLDGIEGYPMVQQTEVWSSIDQWKG